jgi:S1-C subfamily serine protease/predicted esterase
MPHVYPQGLWRLAVAGLLLVGTTDLWAAEDFDSLQEQAIKAAARKIAPSVAQIETSGGTDLIASGPNGPQLRKGIGPTTGLVVSADGYVITSAFNFANKPTAIFVSLPGHKDRFVARAVATDQTRMVTLLKIETTGLPVPQTAPKKDVKIGQTALALGRTWTGPENPPSVSVGIVSALGRIWGKAIQTDAKVSPVNYGGPLVDLQGRVIGVLVPASPRGQDETAGVEWYDSGIGFAIPLEDINAILPRLQKGQDLSRGLLGITPQGDDIYGTAPVVGTVVPGSAAAKAGILPGDVITAINGTPVVRQAEVMHLLGSKYEGDTISVKVKRGTKEIDLANLKLTGVLTAFAHPFLGSLPMRDDPELGVEVRYVYPKSPADAAGLKAGDRVLTIGQGKTTPKPFAGRDGLMTALNAFLPGTEVKMEVRRPGAKDLLTLTLKLAELPETVPDQLPEKSSHEKALVPPKTIGPKPPMPPRQAEKKEEKKEAKAKPETGLLKRTNTAGDHEYWIFVPENYDPNIAHALMVWLHPRGKSKDRDIEAMIATWQDLCEDNHIILVGPKAQNETGWLYSEADSVREAIRAVLSTYTIDHQRVIAHGMGTGGQMAFYMGFHARDTIRGVATTGAVLATQPTDNLPSQRLSFFVVAGGKDPIAKAIAEIKPKLTARKFAVVYRQIADMGHQYLDAPTLQELVRWVDSLDRL